jgi:hypothetical protein
MNDEGYEIEVDGNVALIKASGSKRLFTVTIPDSDSRDEIVGCSITGDYCILATRSPAGSPDLDVKVLAFKHDIQESLWSTKCALYWDDDSIVGSGGLILFTVASLEHKSYIVFVSLPSGFGVDVLDIDSGKRKWCFFSLIPTVLR